MTNLQAYFLQLKLDIIASGTYGSAIRAVEIPDLPSRPKEENRAFDRPRFYRARSELCNEIRIHRVRIVTCYFHSSTGSNFIQRKKTSWSCIYALVLFLRLSSMIYKPTNWNMNLFMISTVSNSLLPNYVARYR